MERLLNVDIATWSGEKKTLRMGWRGPGSGEAGKRVLKVLDIDGMGEPSAIISSQRGGS